MQSSTYDPYQPTMKMFARTILAYDTGFTAAQEEEDQRQIKAWQDKAQTAEQQRDERTTALAAEQHTHQYTKQQLAYVVGEFNSLLQSHTYLQQRCQQLEGKAALVPVLQDRLLLTEAALATQTSEREAEREAHAATSIELSAVKTSLYDMWEAKEKLYSQLMREKTQGVQLNTERTLRAMKEASTAAAEAKKHKEQLAAAAAQVAAAKQEAAAANLREQQLLQQQVQQPVQVVLNICCMQAAGVTDKQQQVLPDGAGLKASAAAAAVRSVSLSSSLQSVGSLTQPPTPNTGTLSSSNNNNSSSNSSSNNSIGEPENVAEICNLGSSAGNHKPKSGSSSSSSSSSRRRLMALLATAAFKLHLNNSSAAATAANVQNTSKTRSIQVPKLSFCGMFGRQSMPEMD